MDGEPCSAAGAAPSPLLLGTSAGQHGFGSASADGDTLSPSTEGAAAPSDQLLAAADVMKDAMGDDLERGDVEEYSSEYMAARHQGRALPQEEEHFSFGFEKPDISQEELRELINDADGDVQRAVALRPEFKGAI